jgi:hypothetical protein
MCHVCICKKKRASRSSSFSAAARRSSPRRKTLRKKKTLRKRKTDRPSFRFPSKFERHFWRFPRRSTRRTVGHGLLQVRSSALSSRQTPKLRMRRLAASRWAMDGRASRCGTRAAPGPGSGLGASVAHPRAPRAHASAPRLGTVVKRGAERRANWRPCLLRRTPRDCLLGKLAREKARVFEKKTRETSVCVCFQSRENTPLRKISLTSPAKI